MNELLKIYFFKNIYQYFNELIIQKKISVSYELTNIYS